jgi:hypothetical protein
MHFIASLGMVWLMVIAALAVGWVMNIITLFRHAADPVTTITILRGIGIFVAPLGGVLGWV